MTNTPRAGSSCKGRGSLANLWQFVVLLSASPAILPVLSLQQLRPHATFHDRASTRAPQLFASTDSSSPSPSGQESSQTLQQKLLRGLLNFALNSPVWKLILVPQARANIEATAEANGIPWSRCKEWISNIMQDTMSQPDTSIYELDFPDYYRKPFHAYESGNLCWDAALEAEIASCAVGARNFPTFGSRGEEAFRLAFENALKEAGAVPPDGSTIVDFGCGTGVSTRRLASSYSQVAQITGVDMSPFFVQVAKQLMESAPTSFHEGGEWIATVQKDARVQFVQGDITTFSLQEDSCDVVTLQFVLHELPEEIGRDVIKNALRILRPGGQLWICEMDFEAPAFAAQRSNPLLFSLIRATEPYLDDYADSIPRLFDFLRHNFQETTIVSATGRHFAAVATKRDTTAATNNNQQSFRDLRFDADGQYKVEDTHLQMWEKRSST